MAQGLAPGSSLILVFLVQILVHLHRCNIRLAAYHNARADTFELFGESQEESLEVLVRILSPDALDFGKTPDSPAEHAVELAREVMARSK
jgi:hypothetical protein